MFSFFFLLSVSFTDLLSPRLPEAPSHRPTHYTPYNCCSHPHHEYSVRSKTLQRASTDKGRRVSLVSQSDLSRMAIFTARRLRDRESVAQILWKFYLQNHSMSKRSVIDLSAASCHWRSANCSHCEMLRQRQPMAIPPINILSMIDSYSWSENFLGFEFRISGQILSHFSALMEPSQWGGGCILWWREDSLT